MGYKGRMAVPDDKRKLFTEQMMKMFYYGGMMSFDDVKLYGHEISLLCPVKKTYGKEVRFHYNYLFMRKRAGWNVSGGSLSLQDGTQEVF